MLFVIFTLLVGIYIRATLGGSLLVIDNEGECLIWSNNNHGCTGYSAPFSLLHGDDCSELSEVKNGTRQDYSVVNVDTCGEQDGKSTAQIQVNKTGLVTFSNRGGNKSECRLNKGFKVGSWCSAVDSGVLYPAQVTSSLASNLSSSPTYTPIANSSSNLSVADMFWWILNFNASEPLE